VHRQVGIFAPSIRCEAHAIERVGTFLSLSPVSRVSGVT
jgi:hypothetical protein